MEIENWKIEAVEVEVKPTLRSDKIKGFVVWHFKTNRGEIKLKGGTVKLWELDGGGKVLGYDAPAYGSRGRFFKCVFFDNKELYLQLAQETVKHYCELTGEVMPNTVLLEEEDER